MLLNAGRSPRVAVVGANDDGGDDDAPQSPPIAVAAAVAGADPHCDVRSPLPWARQLANRWDHGNGLERVVLHEPRAPFGDVDGRAAVETSSL